MKERRAAVFIRIMTATDLFHFHNAVFDQMPENNVSEAQWILICMDYCGYHLCPDVYEM